MTTVAQRRAARITNQITLTTAVSSNKTLQISPSPEESAFQTASFKLFFFPFAAVKVAYFHAINIVQPLAPQLKNKIISSPHICPYYRFIQQKNQFVAISCRNNIMCPREFATIRSPKKSLETSVDHSVCVA